MRSDMFQHEMTGTSEVFGRKKDIKVVFEGKGARTDGSVIYYPALVEGKEVDEWTQLVMRGYGDHESAHLRHTDMKGALPYRKRWNAGRDIAKEGPALVDNILQALEDVRIERLHMRNYPGSQKNLRATATSVNRELLLAVSEGRVTEEQLREPSCAVAVGLTWEGRKGYGESTCGELLDMLDAPMREALERWIGELGECKNTVDACKLAEKIAKELGEGAGRGVEGDGPEGECEEGEDGEGKGEGKGEKGEREDAEGEGEGKEGDGEREGEAEGKAEESEGEGGEESEADAEIEDGEEGKGDAEDGGQDEMGDGEDGEPTDLDVTSKPDAEKKEKPKEIKMPEIGEVLEKELKEAELSSGDVDPSESYVSAAKKYDWFPHAKMKTQPAFVRGARYGHWMNLLRSGEASVYNRKVAAMSGDVNVMRRGLERALMARVERDWHRNLESGKLDTRRFAAAIAGRRDIRKQRDESRDIDTALQVVVDLSGSMASDGKSRVAQDCVLAICEAVGRTGVALEVIGFTNDWGNKMPGLGRVEPLEMPLFKAFDDRLVDAKGPLVTIMNAVDANNADSEALIAAYTRLAKRPEKRKVMMVLSDGEPAFSYNIREKGGHYRAQRVYQQHLRDAVDFIEGEGVECVGIGIMTSAVERYYPKAVVVHNVRDLARVAMGELGAILLGKGGLAKPSRGLMKATKVKRSRVKGRAA